MDREARIRTITRLCDDAGCNGKVQKIHFDQFVNQSWHPHPSAEFKTWWLKQDGYSQGEDVKRAWNCQRYRDEFTEAKKFGIETESRPSFSEVRAYMEEGNPE